MVIALSAFRIEQAHAARLKMCHSLTRHSIYTDKYRSDCKSAFSPNKLCSGALKKKRTLISAKAARLVHAFGGEGFTGSAG